MEIRKPKVICKTSAAKFPLYLVIYYLAFILLGIYFIICATKDSDSPCVRRIFKFHLSFFITSRERSPPPKDLPCFQFTGRDSVIPKAERREEGG